MTCTITLPYKITPEQTNSRIDSSSRVSGTITNNTKIKGNKVEIFMNLCKENKLISPCRD